MPLDPDMKERLLVLARAIGEEQKRKEWWQRVRVFDIPPPVPWIEVDRLHDISEVEGP